MFLMFVAGFMIGLILGMFFMALLITICDEDENC